ncbi:MAG: S-layer homology domain-containing protein [Desulfocucumaceae bacterium]
MSCKISAFRALAFFFLLLAPVLQIAPAGAATSAPTPGFTDLQGHWAASQVTRLATLGIVKGYKDKSYRPDQLVSRLESLVLIMQTAGYTPVPVKTVKNTSKSGSPVKKSGSAALWGQPYLDLAVQKGFLSKSGKELDYDAQASRLDIARLLGRVLLIVPPVDASTFTWTDDWEPDQNSSHTDLKDNTTVPEADRTLINSLVAGGIMTGYPDGTFRPYQAVSRAELATIISRLIDLGWVKTSPGVRQAGWISLLTLNKKSLALELTSLSGKKKYKLSTSAQCFKNGLDWPVNRSYGYRCEIILSGSQIDWINLLEQKETAGAPEKLRGSVKSVILGDENILVVNDLGSRDHTLPIAWDAVLTAKKSTNDFKALKTGSFVDLKISHGQVKEVAVLEVKTLSDTVKEVSGSKVYLKSGLSKSKPGWIKNWEFARVLDSEGSRIDNFYADDKVQITYLDPYPKEIDDEIPLEIKVTKKK